LVKKLNYFLREFLQNFKMTYDILINTISEIVNNDNINKDGLILTYMLPDDIHKSLNKELFYKTREVGVNFTQPDEYEVEIAGIIIKFFKKSL